MSIFKNKTLWVACIILGVASGAWLAYESNKLAVAHSTFENYYAFRGCVQLVEKTDEHATCRLKDGSLVVLVKIDEKWYLKGDGPGVW